ncbi:AMP-binding protein [bacterium]|nr:AMP-binding protein [bacterium]
MRTTKYIFNNLCEMPLANRNDYPDAYSHYYRENTGWKKVTYFQFFRDIERVAAGFIEFGLELNDHVCIFVDNRYEWACTDYALMGIGVTSVPRGTDSSTKELVFLLEHSDSKYMILPDLGLLDALFDHAPDKIKAVKHIFIMDKPASEQPYAKMLKELKQVVFYDDLMEKGEKKLEKEPDLYTDLIKKIDPKTLVSIVYTSGTTGNPKGVMLDHTNFLHNVRAITPVLEIKHRGKEKSLNILPIWHVYERSFEFCTQAGTMGNVYSDPRNMSADLAEQAPHVFASVPRVWQNIYEKVMLKVKDKSPVARFIFFISLKGNFYWMLSKNHLKGAYLSFKKRSLFRRFFAGTWDLIRLVFLFPIHLLAGVIFKPIKQKLGKNMRASYSGAGSLPRYCDNFFNSIGINLYNAYGMTESSPGIMCRLTGRNTLGATGTPFIETEVKVLNSDGKLTEIGEKGVLHARGPQVMRGYYKNPEKTKEILSDDGWLNTGDLAVLTENGDYVIVGREKDTIVLLGGENVEPIPIEETLRTSVYIDHAVLLGQDKKSLEALIVIGNETLEKLAEALKLRKEDIVADGDETIENSDAKKLIKGEARRLVNPKTGFRPFENISNIVLMRKSFIVGKELTHTLKLKRKYVMEQYNHIIAKLSLSKKKKANN